MIYLSRRADAILPHDPTLCRADTLWLVERKKDRGPSKSSAIG
jgi:hypothetical protein